MESDGIVWKQELWFKKMAEMCSFPGEDVRTEPGLLGFGSWDIRPLSL